MDLLATPVRRRILFSALYFSERAPIGFIWWALPTLLRVKEVPLPQITFLTALVVLPWSLKFLWAPLVDVFQSPRWGLRHWIMMSQSVMSLTLLPLFWLDLAEQFEILMVVLVVHALSAATQDVAIDALCIHSTSPAERGSINGWMQAAMLVGRSALGGGALIVAAHVGNATVVALLIAVTISSMFLVAMSHERMQTGTATSSSGGSRVGSKLRFDLVHVLRDRNTWAGLAFAATAGAAFEGVGSVAGPFLVDAGLAQSQVGWFFAVISVPGMSAGALAGGALASRFGPRRTVVGSQAIILVAIVLLATATMLAPGIGTQLALGCLTLMYVGIGLFTAASYTLLMNATDTRTAATQFSAFMGATNACEVWAAFVMGQLVLRLGYPASFIALTIVSLLTLPLLGLFEQVSSQDADLSSPRLHEVGDDP